MLTPPLAGVGLGGNGGIYIGRNAVPSNSQRNTTGGKDSKEARCAGEEKKAEANSAETGPREGCCTLPERRGGSLKRDAAKPS